VENERADRPEVEVLAPRADHAGCGDELENAFSVARPPFDPRRARLAANPVDDVVRHLLVGGVAPPGQHIGFGEHLFGESVVGVLQSHDADVDIITEVLLKLVPRPAARRTMLALYDSIEDAAETVSAIIAARIIPCTLEFLDRMTACCVEDFAHVGLPTDCEAVLLMETDGHPAAVADEAAQMEAIARENRARDVRTARDDAEALQLASARRNAFAALARQRPTTILEDVTVPRSELATMVRFIADTAAALNLQIGTFGHMGDGNLHPTILTDERDAAEMERVHKAFDAMFRRTLELGGTITGEHGVGLAKKPWLRQQMGDASFELMKQVKATLDPGGLLNPGKIFD